ncbi:esterase-like activity of phytase family protein [Synechococcus sp. MIT S9509]|uniref:esterase-like activity of phytase family protein n=1 Tax=Synechococcus sp. MIT S9509 TaxID=1801630 RepID=UPI001E39181D|nr:esterase-like activity of phytase family protein [Synechococcus sp. MIT S9509]
MSTLAVAVAVAVVVAVVMMFQSNLVPKNMMAAALPALPSPAQALPCPLAAGWELIHNIELPGRGLDGDRVGGFSAVAYQRKEDRLWLLSDATTGYLVSFTGLSRLLQGEQASLQGGPRLLLRGREGSSLPADFDGEGLVLNGNQIWIVSEGRRRPERRARLQSYNLLNGRLQREVPLLADWQETEGQGLAANKGPEALTQMASGDLVMAAEAPLIQDSAQQGKDWVRFARLRTGSDHRLEPHGGFEIGPAGAAVSLKLGLTELLALGEGPAVLALLRSFALPVGWSAHLQVLRLPGSESPSAPPIQALQSWDLLASGLPSANWEGMAWGPVMKDGRIPLVLVSDDGFHPFQSSWLSVLAPRRGPDCVPNRFAF